MASERWMSGSRFVASRWRCQATNPQSSTPPAAMTKMVSEKPKMVMGEFLGLSHPQVLDSRTPKTKIPRPAAESTEPTTSSFGGGPGGGRRHLARHDQDKGGDEDLADEHDSPGEHGRRPAADDGADRDAGPSDATDDRVGGLAPGSLEVPGDHAASAGKTSDGTDALEHRPAQSEDRHGLRCRGQGRAAGVDDRGR